MTHDVAFIQELKKKAETGEIAKKIMQYLGDFLMAEARIVIDNIGKEYTKEEAADYLRLLRRLERQLIADFEMGESARRAKEKVEK